MTPATPLRKPKLYFDTAANPSHVTFDDGREYRRNVPWMHYVEAGWEYREPDLLTLEIGEWLITLFGHNLAPLFQAIEERSLLRVCAQPELGIERERESDTFVTQIRFLKPGGVPRTKRGGQTELNLLG